MLGRVILAGKQHRYQEQVALLLRTNPFTYVGGSISGVETWNSIIGHYDETFHRINAYQHRRFKALHAHADVTIVILDQKEHREDDSPLINPYNSLAPLAKV